MNQLRAINRLLFITALLCAVGNSLRGQDLSDEQAIEAGRDALQNSASYPWYNEEEDSLRDLHAKRKQGQDSDTRKTGWEWDLPESNPNPPNFRWSGFPTLYSILQWAAIAFLVVLVVALIVLLVRYFLQDDEAAALRKTEELNLTDRGSEIDRVEQLPFQLHRPDANFLTEARRLYELGHFDEAIVYLYSYQLVQLDKHQHIHLSKGKTNRQYLREVRTAPALRGILQRSMIAFEDVFFGRHALGRDRFEECWQRLDEFHGALDQGVAA